MSAEFRTCYEPQTGTLVFEGRIAAEQLTLTRLSASTIAAMEQFSKTAKKASESLRLLAVLFEELEGM